MLQEIYHADDSLESTKKNNDHTPPPPPASAPTPTSTPPLASSSSNKLSPLISTTPQERYTIVSTEFFNIHESDMFINDLLTQRATILDDNTLLDLVTQRAGNYEEEEPKNVLSLDTMSIESDDGKKAETTQGELPRAESSGKVARYGRVFH